MTAVETPSPREAVLLVVAAIPAGETRAYGEVAAAAGYPGRARWIGKILSELPEGSKIPWHRVTRAGGKIAFPAGSSRHREQRRRLLEEGIAIR